MGRMVNVYGVLCFFIDFLELIKINFIRGFGASGRLKPRGKHRPIIFGSGFGKGFSQ
ncbi:hypothetical protein D9M70_349210 [compost metagenome]